MADDLVVGIKFEINGGAQTVGDVKAISKEIEKINEGNKATTLKASQLAGVYNLAAVEAVAVQEALSAVSKETSEAEESARILAEAYGLSEQEILAVQDAVEKVTEESKEAKAAFEALVTGAAGALAAGIGTYLGEAVSDFSELEQFENFLQNTFGDTGQVQRASELISNFADNSAVNLTAAELSFQSLVGRGIEPTAKQLTQLADIAVAQGKDVDQFVEAILDAQQGENERLKEFGISADATGKQLVLSFRGVTTEVEKTPEAIQAALFALGDIQGVAGSASSRVGTLEGRLTALGNESTRTSRLFGELVSEGIEPLVVGATDLLSGFNALPKSVQSIVTASTAFVGTLATAVTAISAYNLANGKRLVEEAVTTTLLAKKTTIQAANTIATQAATVAQAAYAKSLGTATAAQQAQIAAIGAGAATIAAGTGVVAVGLLNAQTYLTITEEARATKEEIEKLEAALKLLRASSTDAGDDGGFIAYKNSVAQATENVEALEDRLGFVQDVLDKVRGTTFFFNTTATEAAINQTSIQFNELRQEVEDIILAGAQVADALGEGVTIPPGQVENTVAAIDAATAALEAQSPVTAEAIRQRDNQIERLAKYRDEITETTAGVASLSEATGGLKDRLKELNDELKLGELEIAQQGDSVRAALEERRAAGAVSAEQYQSQLRAIEETGFRERIALNTEKLLELRELEATASDDPQLKQEIAKTQNAIDKQRIAAAKKTSQQVAKARQAEEKAAKKAQADEKKRLDTLRKEAVETAKAQGDELKKQRAAASLVQDEAERQRSQDADRQFAETERQAKAAFESQERAATEAFADQQRLADETFTDQQQAQEESFSAQQQAKEKAFNKEQQSEEESFRASLNQERTDGERGFDALAAEVDRRIELASAATDEERQAIEDRLAAEQAAAELRKKTEAEVLRQQEGIISRADTELSPLEQARADFEAKLQEKEAVFQSEQAAAAEAFNLKQRAASAIFEETQEQSKLAFEQQQQDAAAAFDDQQRATAAAFAAAERVLEQAFKDQQRAIEANFKDQQRSLDEQSAQEIAQLLENARASFTPAGRAAGGPVSAGMPYMVGEKGPELIFPSRGGFVATARETARLLRGGVTVGSASVAGSSSIEAKLDQLIRITERQPKLIAPATINLGGGSTSFDAIQIALEHQRAQFRGMGL